MMWPRRPTTWTRSAFWGNSKTVVPSTDVRFDFPSLRIVAIRIVALNFSVTMSRRTEGFAHRGRYLIVWRWMFPCDGSFARAFSSRARGSRLRTPDPRRRRGESPRRPVWDPGFFFQAEDGI